MEVKKGRNDVEGLPQSYLEERMKCYREEGDWQAVVDILGLLIYGIILFPHLEDYVDLAAIDVFLAVRYKNENPVPAILADTYYTLHYCLDNLRCYIHILYLWMIAHCCPGKCKIGCPIEDYKWGCIKTMIGQEWIHHLMEVSEGTIRWYPKWNERETFIASCRKSPNVPLMGTQGCSNYNPILTLRQNGYLIMTPPTKRLTTPLLYEGDQSVDQEAMEPRQIERNGLPFERIQQDGKTGSMPETPDPPIVRELEKMLKNVETKRKVLKRKLINAIALQGETQEVIKE
ncbi:hypothetical protein CR513_49703, partial [Mucuna pruriens]